MLICARYTPRYTHCKTVTSVTRGLLHFIATVTATVTASVTGYSRIKPRCNPYGPKRAPFGVRIQPGIFSIIEFISRVSACFIFFGSPPKHSTHISSAQTFVRLKVSPLSRAKPSSQYMRRSDIVRLSQSSGIGRSRNSRIRPSLVFDSLWLSCSCKAISAASPLRYSGSPIRQRTTASAHIWSTSPGRSRKMSFVGFCRQTSTGQKRRLPVRSRRNSESLVVPKNTHRRG